jgi:hypothetical protein
MKIDDSHHFLLITFGVLALPCYVSVLLWRDYKWVRHVFHYSIVAVLACVSYGLLMQFAPDSFPVKLAIMGSTLAGFFCLWRVVFGLGIQMLSDLGVAAIALIILPVMFTHNSELIALGLQNLIQASVPSWVGYLILGFLLLLTVSVVYISGIQRLIKMVVVVYVASSLLFIAVRLAILEGPAPDFANTDLNCFDSTVLDRCPLGLDDPIATAAFIVFVCFSLCVIYRGYLCRCFGFRPREAMKKQPSQARVKVTKYGASKMHRSKNNGTLDRVPEGEQETEYTLRRSRGHEGEDDF